ncbi:ABC transporter ATP-binding protein [Dechloromonas denitrificans]|uniref:ABC transporter ATP-binding protein n=1 Tax=Dechloromonas denitrificans TaxID=281362 RepID=UPI001CF90D46|nr:ABC transporter ATP-binding protein [Dechloromonas denitrificans]UCV05359.1 ABC transporter ATP-binding protein [Dechloromonas denitrificans]UCV09704.1 ABC transporter ATP-binding protein [Dechloromonas denitrificans]
MIQFTNVAKNFRRARVLDGINLNIGLGERVALIGSNGAGKTTLIRCLLGEYTFEGSVSINGLDPRSNRTEVLGNIGFVPQLPPPLKMPVGQLIEFSAALCGTDPQHIHQIAKRLGLDLDSILSRQFVRLSGGMKQKLLIAIALGRDATVLVMDEPAANLDPEARKIFFDLLAERLDDATMIISSHRLDEVSSLVNRVIEMDTGKVVLDDKVTDAVSLTAVLNCRIVLQRFEPAFAKALDGWKFTSRDDNRVWEGEIAGPDRLRFLGIVSRYTGLVSDLSLAETKA